jgi:hypothetical protein
MTTEFYDVHIEAWLKQIAGQGSTRTSSGIRRYMKRTSRTRLRRWYS